MGWRNALQIFSNDASPPLLYQQQGCLVAALDTYPLEKRCLELSRLFHELPFKELQHYLPTVLEHVFGFGANVGWSLQNITHGQQGFNEVRRFLSPEGPLLLLIYRLLSDASVNYEFPVSCLPLDTRSTLSTGGVPPFCSGRIPTLGALGPQGPTVLQINAFELYMFHFAYYIVNPSQPGSQHQFQQSMVLDVIGGEGQRAPGTILDSLYLALLHDYLHYYLPHDRDFAPELPGYHPHHQVPSFGGSMPTRQVWAVYLPACTCIMLRTLQWEVSVLFHPIPSPLYRERDNVFWNGMSSPGRICPNSTAAGVVHRHVNNEPCLIRKDILQSIYSGSGNMSNYSTSTPPRHYGTTMVSTPPSGFPILTSSPLPAPCSAGLRRVLRRLTEVRVLHPLPCRFHHTFSTTEDCAVPSQLHMLIVRMMVKHLHQFRYSEWRNASSSAAYPCNIQTPMDDIKLKVLPRLLRKRLYLFLKHALASWPLDSSLRLPLETWLSFIQPWRYSSSQIRHPDRHKSASHGVEAHWQPFVQEHLLFYTELLGVLLPRFLRMDLASRYCAFVLYRCTKVLFQPNLFAMITEAEASLGNGGQSASPVSNALQRQAVSAPVATLVRQHMADVEEPGFVYRPLNGEERRKQVIHLVQLARQACRAIDRQLQEKLGVEGSRNSSVAQQHHSLANARSSGGGSRLSCLWGALKRTGKKWLKLRGAFKLNKDIELSSLALNGHEPLSLFASSRDVTDSTMGRNGFQQCLDNTKAHKYQGNPDTEPIRSYEVVFLVRLLHLLSTAINDKANNFKARLLASSINKERDGSPADASLTACQPATFPNLTHRRHIHHCNVQMNIAHIETPRPRRQRRNR
ncbi:hypothetical protein MRX96_059045 [Rhipicephalus microplus]